jgi:regulator of replication initiation timing
MNDNWENEFDEKWANKDAQFGYIGAKARQEIKDWIKENVIKKLENNNTKESFGKNENEKRPPKK